MTGFKNYNIIIFVITFLSITSCQNDEVPPIIIDGSLAGVMEDKTVELGAVIACAASESTEANIVSVFFYPETGATNIRLYETANLSQDSLDFSNYFQVPIPSEPFFNGYLGKFQINTPTEKWVVVTFTLDGEFKVSSPIRIKNQTKPTTWSNAVTVNQGVAGQPNFIWSENATGDNAIYFQVISTVTDDLLSGTYTYDNHFQYYDTENVVLNITEETPPNLSSGTDYNFTMMDVSEDNWVNLVVQKTFTVE